MFEFSRLKLAYEHWIRIHFGLNILEIKLRENVTWKYQMIMLCCQRKCSLKPHMVCFENGLKHIGFESFRYYLRLLELML